MRYKKMNLYHTWSKEDIERLQEIIQRQQQNSKNKRVSWIHVLKELNNPEFTLTQVKSQYYNLSLNRQNKQIKERDSPQQSLIEPIDNNLLQDENGNGIICKQLLELFTRLVNNISVE